MKSPFTGGNVLLKSEPKELQFRKETFEIRHWYYKCVDTGEEFTTDEIDQINVSQLYNQYREKYRIPFPDEIKSIREKYNIPASKMSEILGMGINSFRQYEGGDIPTVANGRLILAAGNPTEFKRFLNANRGTLSDKEYHRYLKTTDTLIENEERNFWDNIFLKHIFSHESPSEFTGYRKPETMKIALMISFFSQKTENLWKTKLNKLLFYSDFLHFKRSAFSISGIAYRAIQMGPVPAEYDKMYIKLTDDELIRLNQIEFSNGDYGEAFEGVVPFEQTHFSESELKAMNDVADRFAGIRTNELIDISHKEKAWSENKEHKTMISYLKYAFDLSEIE